MSSQTGEIAYLNGQFVAAEQAVLPVSDLGIVAAAAVTEMIRTFRGQPFRLREHLRRLDHSIQLTRLPSVDLDLLESAIREVVEHNTAQLGEDEDLGIIVFVTAGPNPTYLGEAGRELFGRPTVCVHTFRLPFEFWMDTYDSGQSLTVSDTRPPISTTLPPAAKFRSRLHWHIADADARAKHPGSRAILNSPDGLTETSAGNFFLVENETLVTPPDDIVLNGVSRAVVLELAASIGLRASKERIDRERALQADEAFTTSTTYCLLPVATLDTKRIGQACPGPTTQRLLDAWNALVGLDIIAQSLAAGQSRLPDGPPPASPPQ